MSKQIAILLISLIGFFFSMNASALVEARVTYGMLASKPDLQQLSFGGMSDIPAAAANYGIGADAIVVLPIIGLGAGLRYENLGFKFSSNGIDYKSSASRTALLVNYRLINTLLYLGPIFSYGISHSNNITVTYGGSTADLTPDSSSSYTIGLEGGSKIGGFLLGAELGYENFQWKTLKDKNGTLTTEPNLDMNGTYAKVILGFAL